MFLQTLAMATPPAAEGADAVGGNFTRFMPLIFMVAIFYFLWIRPQKRREKERKELLSTVKSGERVLLSNGIIGEIRTVKDRTMIVRIAKDTDIEVLKSTVSQVIEQGETPDEVKG